MADSAEKSGAYTSTTVFDALSGRLQATLGDLSRKTRLDEETVSKAMREIRLALLEADVNFQVARDFVAAVNERALGQDVLKGLNAGQQVVKIVHEELTELMGSGDSRLAFGKPPTVVLLCGSAGLGQDDGYRQAGAASAQARAAEAGSRRRRLATPGGDRPARAARRADPGSRLPHRHAERGRGGLEWRRARRCRRPATP